MVDPATPLPPSPLARISCCPCRSRVTCCCARPAAPGSPGSCPSAPSSAARCDDSCPERSEEHTSELQSPCNLVCRLLLEKKKKITSSPCVRSCAAEWLLQTIAPE